MSMTSGGQRPPRLASWLLQRLTLRRGPDIEAGLAEFFRVRAGRDGIRAARVWYWRQVIGFALRWRSLRGHRATRLEWPTGDLPALPARTRDTKAPISAGGHAWSRAVGDVLGQALRGLRRAPGLTLMVALALALGIGANTAVFSVVNSVLLDPLPYEGAGRIAYLWQYLPDSGYKTGLPYERALELRARSETLERIEVFDDREGVLRDLEQDVPVTLGLTTPGLFEGLRLEARIGRNITESDTDPGAPNVVMLSEAMWRQRFGASSDILDRVVTVDAVPRVVIGVVDASVHYLQGGIDLWLPIRDEPLASSWPTVLAWRTPEASVEQAVAEMEILTFEDERNGTTYPWLLLPDEVVAEETRALLYATLAAVWLVLLIGCVNVALLMLTRGAARRREIAVRAALGAGRGRIVGELFLESGALALAGGVMGVGLAFWCVDLLTSLQPDSLRIAYDDIRLDGTALAYTAGLSMLAGLFSGMAPVVHAWSWQPAEAMRRGGSATVARGGGRFARQALLVGEVVLSVVLLVGAGLLVHSLVRLQRADPGYDVEGLSSLPLSVVAGANPAPQQLASFYEQVLEALRGTGAVEGAALADPAPVHDLMFSDTFEVEGTGEVYERVRGPLTFTAPGYFSAMGIPIIDGRDFDGTDAAAADTPVIVNQVFAERFFPGASPVGRRFRREQPESRGGPGSPLPGSSTWYRIVGVAGNAVQADPLDTEYDLQFYQPLWNIHVRIARNRLARFGVTDMAVEPIGMSLLLRVPAGVSPPFGLLDDRLRPLGAEVEAGAARPIRDKLSAALDGPRFNALLFAAFAMIALSLSSVGLYGVVSHFVQRRAREMGIRVAIGARAVDVRRLVLRQGMLPVLAGVVLGLAGATAAGHVIAGILYLVEPLDPLVFTLVPLVLLSIAVAAIWWPALRATRVDPVDVLRAE